MLETNRTIILKLTNCKSEIEFCIIISCITGIRRKGKSGDETEVKTPKTKKEISTPQTFPKANKKV